MTAWCDAYVRCKAAADTGLETPAYTPEVAGLPLAMLPEVSGLLLGIDAGCVIPNGITSFASWGW